MCVFFSVLAGLVAHCGIWPSFDPALLDAGIDARDVPRPPMDMGVMDTGTMKDASVDATTVDATGDAGGPPGGFRVCPVPPPSGPFVPQRVFPGGVNATDLVFDGRSHVAVGGAQLTLIDSTGSRTSLTMASGGLGIVGVTAASGDEFLVTTSILAAPSIQRIYRDGGITSVTDMLPMMANLRDIAVHRNGSIYFADVGNNAVYRIAPASTSPVRLAMIQTPTGLTLTPDQTQLFVGSSSTNRIYVIHLTMDGDAMAPPMVYVDGASTRDSMGNEYRATASGLAFDACGYLYVSDRDLGRILRVAPGGRSFDVVMVGAGVDAGMLSPWGIAFGHGAGFDPRSLYFVDFASRDVYRIEVGVEGATSIGGM